jgi:ATP-dependent exoDNAse (exonuclease V) alpha subunit
MPETIDSFSSRVLGFMQQEPTEGQKTAIVSLSAFLASGDCGVFVLKGFAGTGKTTLVSALTKVLQRFVLLAPTGRAAKVLSSYSGKHASTIHRHIYKVTVGADSRPVMSIGINKNTSAIYIVDESSMIGDSAQPGNAENLLQNLIEFVLSGTLCSLILVGDTAQLPPVHSEYSPALDTRYLNTIVPGTVTEIELKEVLRQKQESGILMNATALRILIGRNAAKPVLKTAGFSDIQQVTSYELKELLEESYREFGKDEVLIITRSNKAAVQYNQMIRFQLFYMEEELSQGDRLMVVKNNYLWLADESKAGFIANGDVVVVDRVFSIEEKYGLRFASVQLHLEDYDDTPFEATLTLNTLYSQHPALSAEEQKYLYDEVFNQYSGLKSTARKKQMREDPYLNALQVKFAYAVTCHKSQGGQWKSVFVDQGFIDENSLNTAHLRWLYTAFTRATEKLYLLNFDSSYFKN